VSGINQLIFLIDERVNLLMFTLLVVSYLQVLLKLLNELEVARERGIHQEEVKKYINVTSYKII